jgi:hypothetical protein
MPRALAACALAVPLGLVLGAGGQTVDLLHPGLRWAAALGVPWLAVAFAAGALARERAAAVAAGAVVLVVATGTYYVLHLVAWRNPGVAWVALAWVPACVAAGGLFALAGAVWRDGGPAGRAAGAAVLAGALVGESLLLSAEWPGRAAHLVLTAELLAGATLPLLLARRVLPAALVLTAVAALILGTAEGEVRETLRGVGWRGL